MQLEDHAVPCIEDSRSPPPGFIWGSTLSAFSGLHEQLQRDRHRTISRDEIIGVHPFIKPNS
jgi:hypothetical protein